MLYFKDKSVDCYQNESNLTAASHKCYYVERPKYWKLKKTTCLLLSKQANESTWLKKSLASPGIPMPRKNFAKPNILSPGSCKQNKESLEHCPTEIASKACTNEYTPTHVKTSSSYSSKCCQPSNDWCGSWKRAQLFTYINNFLIKVKGPIIYNKETWLDKDIIELTNKLWTQNLPPVKNHHLE